MHGRDCWISEDARLARARRRTLCEMDEGGDGRYLRVLTALFGGWMVSQAVG